MKNKFLLNTILAFSISAFGQDPTPAQDRGGGDDDPIHFVNIGEKISQWLMSPDGQKIASGLQLDVAKFASSVVEVEASLNDDSIPDMINFSDTRPLDKDGNEKKAVTSKSARKIEVFRPDWVSSTISSKVERAMQEFAILAGSTQDRYTPLSKLVSQHWQEILGIKNLQGIKGPIDINNIGFHYYSNGLFGDKHPIDVLNRKFKKSTIFTADTDGTRNSSSVQACVSDQSKKLIESFYSLDKRFQKELIQFMKKFKFVRLVDSVTREISGDAYGRIYKRKAYALVDGNNIMVKGKPPGQNEIVVNGNALEVYVNRTDFSGLKVHAIKAEVSSINNEQSVATQLIDSFLAPLSSINASMQTLSQNTRGISYLTARMHDYPFSEFKSYEEDPADGHLISVSANSIAYGKDTYGLPINAWNVLALYSDTVICGEHLDWNQIYFQLQGKN